MLRRIGILGLGLVAMLTVTAADAPLKLAHRFEAGASHRYRIQFNAEAEFRGATMSQLGDLEVTLKCVSVAEGKNFMEMRFDKVEMSRAMFGNMEADPNGEKLAGQTVTFIADNQGEVSDIKPGSYFEGWDEIRRAVEPVMKNWYLYLPAEPVAAGAEWNREQNDATGQSDVTSVTVSKFKFKGMKKEKGRDCAAIEAAVENKVSGISSNPMGTFQVKGSGKGKIEFSFDPAAGIIVSSSGRLDEEMNMTPSSGSGEPVDSIVGFTIKRELL